MVLSPETLSHLVPENEEAQLEQVPEGVRALQTEVRVLRVQSSLLKSVPDWVGELKCLTTLDVNGLSAHSGWDNSSMTALPESIGNLETLKNLILVGLQGLRALPQSVGKLSSLQTFKIDQCGVTAMPASFVRMTALTSLHIAKCSELEELPADIGRLSVLKELMISSNPQVQELPTSITSLGALQHFTLHEMASVATLVDFKNLSALATLTISACSSLTRLPEGIGELTNLKELNVTNLGALQELPASARVWIGLAQLEVLQLGASARLNLSMLPRMVAGAWALKHLHLHRLPQLQELPAVTESLTLLERLIITDCRKLIQLPESVFWGLQALQELTLRLEALKELPDMGRLSALRRLELSCSRVAQLPGSIRHLTGLQQLSIDSCTFRDFPDIQVLTNLRTLELVMTKYAADCKVFRSLSRSLPCLRRLHKLSLRMDVVETLDYGSKEDSFQGQMRTGISDEDVLAIGRSLRAWPLPLLHDITDSPYTPGLRLHQQKQALGLPDPAREIPDEFMVNLEGSSQRYLHMGGCLYMTFCVLLIAYCVHRVCLYM